MFRYFYPYAIQWIPNAHSFVWARKVELHTSIAFQVNAIHQTNYNIKLLSAVTLCFMQRM